MSKDEPKPVTFDALTIAAGKVLRPLPQLVAVVSSLGALAYCIGWVRAGAYFDDFGAPWAVSYLSSASLLKMSLEPIAVFGGMFLFCLIWYTEDIRLRRKSNEILLWCIVAGGAISLLAGAVGVAGHLSLALLIYTASYSAWAGGAATVAYEILYSQVRGGRDRPAWFALSALMLLWITLWVLPRAMGRADAFAVSSEEGTLAGVRIPDSEDQDWKLLALGGDRAVVLRLNEEGDTIALRIIEAVKLGEISPSEQ